jgi:DNA-binding XRE family transcriptional regulator
VSTPTLNFKQERLNRGLSQKAMAEEVGVTTSTWNRLELTGAVGPSNRLRVADFFSRKVTDIWPLDEEPAAA